MAEQIPTFEEWVEDCFTYANQDFRNYGEAEGEEFAAIEARGQRFAIPNPSLTEYAIRLFSDPGFIADQYTDEQIAEATWFLFGTGSEYFHDFRAKDVGQDKQIEAIRSVRTMYTDLYDRVCNKQGTEPDGQFTNVLPIDKAVGMIWDMDNIEGPALFPKDWPHLTDPSFEVLETALFKCRTASCKGSALHGLGHLHHVHPRRVENLIDRFLDSPDQPDHLREYAKLARTGCVL